MGVLLRKIGGGADSYGHVWKTDRSVVEVTDEQAADLLAIADAGFTVVQAADDEAGETGGETGADGERTELTEPAPEDPQALTEPAPETSANASATGHSAGRQRAHKATSATSATRAAPRKATGS